MTKLPIIAIKIKTHFKTKILLFNLSCGLS